MAKDPAFLFYTNDFFSGTQFLSDEQVGKYIRLMMAQHQHGHLTEEQMIFICKSHDKQVFSKFTKDDDGLYFQKRLEVEILKRKSYTESRTTNRKGKVKSKAKPIKNTSKSYDKHMEDVNKDRNINELDKAWKDFFQMRKEIRKPATERAKEMLKSKLDRLSQDDEHLAIKILEQSILKSWQDLFELKVTPEKSGRIEYQDK